MHKIEASNLKCEVCEKKEESTQHLFECEGDTEIRRNGVVKNTPMVTLTENSASAIARVLERRQEKKENIHGRKECR